MSGFASLLKRLNTSIAESKQRRVPHVTIATRDLEEVLRLFRGMDAKERLHYPDHVEMMADAAQKALPHLQGAYAADIMHALDCSRPGWRNN